MGGSDAFLRLDPRIQRYLWAEGWRSLRDAQEQAIPLILEGDRDVLIAAQTATGKTEAAFLPALTHLLQRPDPGLIVYIAPLKALINDQCRRLERLGEVLDVPVYPWHGDIPATSKTKFMRRPHGTLLITPESLEAMLCARGSTVAAVFQGTTFFVIDELHAFIGTERGTQLQSLMHRIEVVTGRVIPRIGLSATLGELALAARFLRAHRPVAIIDASADGLTLRTLWKGFEEPAAPLAISR